ncbi:MAG: fimbrillin family protein [Prevotella sp.]|nr:fimbrillin family protein [Prevotella sp.]
MKQFGFSILAMFFAGLAFTACSSDDDVMATQKPTTEVDEEASISFSANVNPAGAVTRVNPAGNAWSLNDKIGITMTTGTPANDDSTSIATVGAITRYNWGYTINAANLADGNAWSCDEPLELKRYSGAAYNFYAYYPYSADEGTGVEGAMPSKLPINTAAANQPGQDTTNTAIDFLYGSTSVAANAWTLKAGKYDVTIPMNHKMAKMTVTLHKGDGLGDITALQFNISGVKLEGNFNPLTGKITITSSSTAAVGLVTGKEVAADGDWVVTLLLMPQTITNPTLTVSATVDSESKTFTKNITGDWLTLAAGNNYAVNLTLDSGAKLNITGVAPAGWTNTAGQTGTLEE